MPEKSEAIVRTTALSPAARTAAYALSLIHILDVSVQAVPFVRLFDSTHDAQVLLERVPPFGNPRI